MRFKNEHRKIFLCFFLFFIFLGTSYLLISHKVTDRSVLSQFLLTEQSERLPAQIANKRPFEFDQKAKEALYLSLIQGLEIEKSPYYISLKIPHGKLFCKAFLSFEIIFEAEGFHMSGDIPFIRVKKSCDFENDVIAQVPLDYQKNSPFIEYYLGILSQKGFFQYERWILSKISFKKDSFIWSPKLEELENLDLIIDLSSH